MNEGFIGGIFLSLAGLFCLLASYYNWDFFFNSRKAYFFIMILGRTGTRVFYAILGIILLLGGIISFLVGAGIIKN